MPQAILTTSWDDGHPLDQRLAELLVRYGLTGTFYIPRAISTGLMSDTQIRDLSSRFEIGAHTLNHVFLNEVDPTTARGEIEGSRNRVQDLTGQDCPMFCPPAGKFRRQHLDMISSAGFEAFRTVEYFSLDHPRPMTSLLEMPTTIHAHPQTVLSCLRNVAKRRAARNLCLYTFHGRSRNWTTLAQRLLNRALAVGGVFHLWGHSWEIDAARQWVQLEQILRRIGELVAAGQARCLTNSQLCQESRARIDR